MHQITLAGLRFTALSPSLFWLPHSEGTIAIGLGEDRKWHIQLGDKVSVNAYASRSEAANALHVAMFGAPSAPSAYVD